MVRWKAVTVVAWLEATMNMPQYADTFKVRKIHCGFLLVCVREVRCYCAGKREKWEGVIGSNRARIRTRVEDH
jgi:hypothetical protein